MQAAVSMLLPVPLPTWDCMTHSASMMHHSVKHSLGHREALKHCHQTYAPQLILALHTRYERRCKESEAQGIKVRVRVRVLQNMSGQEHPHGAGKSSEAFGTSISNRMCTKYLCLILNSII